MVLLSSIYLTGEAEDKDRDKDKDGDEVEGRNMSVSVYMKIRMVTRSHDSSLVNQVES